MRSSFHHLPVKTPKSFNKCFYDTVYSQWSSTKKGLSSKPMLLFKKKNAPQRLSASLVILVLKL